MQPSTPVLTASDLNLSYGAHPVLQRWSATIAAGLTLIVGDEGSGKTSLLNVLAGVSPPSGGTLHVCGVDFAREPQRYRAQVFWIDPRTTAFDAVVVSDFLHQQKAAWPQWNSALFNALVEGFDITPHLHKQMHMLSTGSRRKVFLACAFASGAPLTLLDTPMGALDKRSVQLLEELLEDAAAQDKRAFVLADYEAPAIAGIHGPLLLQRP